MSVAALPDGPRGKPIVGNLLDFRRDPLRFLTSLARDYGDVARFRLGPEKILLLNHPDLIRDVLVTHSRNFKKSRGLEMAKRFLGEGLLTAEGDFHRRQRRLVQPAFHRQRLASYAEVMAGYAARVRDRWQPGARLDVAREMTALTLAVVGKTLFDADVEGESQEIGAALSDILQLFDRITSLFSDVLDWLPLPSNRRFERGRRRLDATIYRIIAERRASGADRGDLLSMLLLAADEEGDGGHMTDLQVRDEAMTLFLAGHETTANALTWTWYLLSQNPEAETRLHAEVDSVLGGRLPVMDDVPRLAYTERVLAESMRLYPPAWIIGRRALEDYAFRTYRARARSIFVMSPWVTHHDSRWFPNPFRFDPERFTEEARDARPKFAYFPFGGGPRVCIGESFAWMEGVLILATIAQKWRLRLEPGAAVAPRPLITLRPRGGMPMIAELRDGNAATRGTA
jgi:cytochrome P450